MHKQMFNGWFVDLNNTIVVTKGFIYYFFNCTLAKTRWKYTVLSSDTNYSLEVEDRKLSLEIRLDSLQKGSTAQQLNNFTIIVLLRVKSVVLCT